jgi:hypothetical protein
VQCLKAAANIQRSTVGDDGMVEAQMSDRSAQSTQTRRWWRKIASLAWSDRFLPVVSVLISLGVIAADARVEAVRTCDRVIDIETAALGPKPPRRGADSNEQSDRTGENAKSIQTTRGHITP